MWNVYSKAKFPIQNLHISQIWPQLKKIRNVHQFQGFRQAYKRPGSLRAIRPYVIRGPWLIISQSEGGRLCPSIYNLQFRISRPSFGPAWQAEKIFSMYLAEICMYSMPSIINRTGVVEQDVVLHSEHNKCWFTLRGDSCHSFDGTFIPLPKKEYTSIYFS